MSDNWRGNSSSNSTRGGGSARSSGNRRGNRNSVPNLNETYNSAGRNNQQRPSNQHNSQSLVSSSSSRGRGGGGYGRGSGRRQSTPVHPSAPSPSGSSTRSNQSPQQIHTRFSQNALSKTIQPQDLVRFLNSLSHLNTNKLLTTLQGVFEKQQWIACWDSANYSTFNIKDLNIMVEAVARFPVSNNDIFESLQLSQFTGAFSRFIDLTRNENPNMQSSSSVDSVIKRVEAVYNAVQRLLKMTWNAQQNEIKQDFENILYHSSSALNIRSKEHRMVSEKINTLLDEFDKPWLIKTTKDLPPPVIDTTQRLVHKGKKPADTLEYMNWRNATVSWLSNITTFQPTILPVMKREFSSPEEYFETILRLWVAVTFDEGNSALFPHCRFRDKEKDCGHVLWYVGETSGSVGFCSQSRCGKPVSYACPNKYHNRNLCSDCIYRAQEQLRGPPGSHASTNIYDARVARINFDGKIMVDQLQSRRPPQVPIHWRTTRRLCSPNLVGIVFLSKSGSSLNPEDKIHWAEIVDHSHQQDGPREFMFREKGCVAFSIFDFREFSSRKQTVVDLKHGDPVAIIDCNTFVPEYIPVLIALEMQKLSPLPFKKGALLNLGGSRESLELESTTKSPMELQAILNAIKMRHAYNSDDSDVDESIEFEVQNSEIELAISQLIDESDLDPIIQIRRDAGMRQQLFMQLVALVSKATLDPGQMNSFVGALTHPVHCTQGPPGTGKSYTGVVIVRALLIIRELWLRANPSVGMPPILVLSYKNHAIDEFLSDLIKVSPSTKLIRIGNSSDPVLSRHLERTVVLDQLEVKQCRQRLESLHNFKTECANFNESLAIIAVARTDTFHPDENEESTKRRRDVTYRAAQAFYRLIARVNVTMHNLLELDPEDEESEPELWANAEFNQFESDLRVSNGDGLMLTYSDVPLLYNGIKHYDDNMDVREILWRWLFGFTPQPQCEFKFEDGDVMDMADFGPNGDGVLRQCTKISDPGSKFCDAHRCYFSVIETERCTDKTIFNKQYCGYHACQEEECALYRINPNQPYCPDHSCFICLQSGLVAKLAMDVPPRNTCLNHLLCSYLLNDNGRITQCPILAEPNSYTCKEHTPVQCQGRLNSGRQCRNSGTVLYPYCNRHSPQFTNNWTPWQTYGDFPSIGESVQVADNSKEEKDAVCIALTKKGKKCTDSAYNGTNYCKNHQDSKFFVKEETKPLKKDVVTVVDKGTTVEEKGKEIEKSKTEDKDLIEIDGAESPEEFVMIDADAMSEDSSLFDEPENRVGDNIDEMEEGDHLQHLRDVFGNENQPVFDDEFEDEAAFQDAKEEISNEATSIEFVMADQFSWSMSLEQRWNAISGILNKWFELSKELDTLFHKATDLARKQFHDAEVRAKLKVYEGKEVIGGTIVGCITRLEAIRSTNPFAVLVEEASEVLEPLLFACLGSTTCKFEQIGDHLQLAPSMMSKFDFERISKMNVSLFQRLIEAEGNSEVPSTVLTIQRRMRKNIADLTREFYIHITEIEDHPICNSRVIGSSLPFVNVKLGVKSENYLKLLPDKGREVPGVLPHIYFWTHEGVQSRAKVGLSKVNVNEAMMVCKLAKYLVECGVPKRSIACLTPYKGQLMLIRETLMSKEFGLIERMGYNNKNRHSDSRPPNSVVVSTVDRFQGDENDIVIVSLVIDSKATTPFVKLQNRMIVLLSRARLGMYIIGNVGYFENSKVPHWKKTLDHLMEPADNDSAIANVVLYNGIRIGPKLPLCCPIHREISKHAKDHLDVKLGFCDLKCLVPLNCSHSCNTNCHWPRKEHNADCNELVLPLCQRHPEPIRCTDVYKSVNTSLKTRPILEVLPSYDCQVQVDVQLPCSHSQMFKCFEETRLSSGEMLWPKCTQTALRPYVYTVCKHILKCLCYQLEEWEMFPARVKQCNEMVIYNPDTCEDSEKMKCYMKQQYTSGKLVYHCKVIKSIQLPRCGHGVNVLCETAQEIAKWGKAAFTEIGIVYEGVEYGAKDYNCREKSNFIRKCGHVVELDCETAFERAQNPGKCSNKVKINNPECGHRFEATCHQNQEIVERQRKGEISIIPLDPVKVVDLNQNEGGFRDYNLNFRCREPVLLKRICGHEMKLRCQEARNPPVCAEFVDVSNPVCGHTANVPCSLRDFGGWDAWDSNCDSHSRKMFELLLKEGTVRSDSLVAPNEIPDNLSNYLGNCKAKIKFVLKQCGHEVEMKCCEAMKLIWKIKSSDISQIYKLMPKCSEKSNRELTCGHFRMFECHKYDEYLKNPEKIKCSEMIQRKCWNFDVCQQNVNVNCSTASNEVIRCESLSPWTCVNSHTFEIPQCSEGIPLDCPSCSDDAIEKAIAIAKLKTTSEENIFVEIPREYELALNVVKDFGTLTRLSLSKSDYEREIDLYSRYQSWIDAIDPWEQPIFRSRTIIWFKPILSDANNLEVDVCKWRKANTFHAAEVFPLTPANIRSAQQSLPKKKQIYVVIGLAKVCRASVNPKKLPPMQPPATKAKGVKRNAQQNENHDHILKLNSWVHQQVEQGYDSMLIEKGETSKLYILEPLALFATHLIRLPTDELKILGNAVEQYCNMGLDLGQSFIRRTAISNPNNFEQDAPESTFDVDVARRLWSKEMKFPKSWDGYLLRGNGVTPTIEKTLSQKLLFAGSQEKESSKSDENPFAGIRYLEHLATTFDHPNLKLLSSLELMHIGGYLREANAHFNEYIQEKRSSTSPMHPLTLLASARINIISKNIKDGKSFLKKFVEIYADVALRWLSSVEKELLDATKEGVADAIAEARAGESKTAKEMWEDLKIKESCKSKAMDKLLKLTGLMKAKIAAVQMFKSAVAFNKMSEKARKLNSTSMNYCFIGNPGTGKTTVARLFAEILYDSKMRSEHKFTESTAQTLKDKGADEFKKMVSATLNGTFFIDEAYDLDPIGDFKGKPIVSELLAIAENQRDEISFILAGYEDEMANKFFAFNEGLKSRFEEIVFEDFNEKELNEIWNRQLVEKGWEADPKVGKLVARRLVVGAKRKGFGNARSVRKVVEQATRRAMSRDDFDGALMEITTEDVIGPNPLQNPKIDDILVEFDKKTGWASIKSAIREFIDICGKNYVLELEGKPKLPVMLNRMFLGNPGTGKTTCSELYAKILKELNFLSVGGVVFKTASDFVGSHVGESQTKTGKLIENSRGKVLVIDEAYNLNNSLYGKQVLDTMVEKVQGTESDDIAVLLLGYEKQMEEMIRTQNPGLARRFSKDYAFRFEDYTDAELLQIFNNQCRQQGISISYEVSEKAIRTLSQQRAQANFGNAGAVNLLIKSALAKASARLRSSSSTKISLKVEDIEGVEFGKGNIDEILSPLNSLYGVENIREALQQMINNLTVALQEGGAEPEIGHFVFRGSPGTGKTTVARVMAKILYQLGLLPTNRLVETSGLEMTGEYVGHTKKRVEEKLGEAREAYELGRGHYGSEAVSSLVAAMTSPEYKGLVIIVAGYLKDMDAMLNTNSGLKSRFTRYFDFNDWGVDECSIYFRDKAQKENFTLEPEVLEIIADGCKKMKEYPNFGNGRDVVALWRKVMSERANRVASNAEIEKTIAEEDARIAVDLMLKDRKPPEGSTNTAPSLMDRFIIPEPMPMFKNNQKSEFYSVNNKSFEQSVQQQHESRPRIEEIEDEEESEKEEPGRDPGVSDEVWKELEKAKKEHTEKLERMKKEMEEEELREALRKEKLMQERLRQICLCPMGFQWFKVGNGWRCGGGSHFVSDKQLWDQFSV